MKDHIKQLKKIVDDNNAFDQVEDIQPFLEDWRGNLRGSTPLILFPTNSEQIQKIIYY